ncbi:MAG TPA: class I SAM-dependent methyltransferase [Chitinispirillaceae bacterium]|nr:class I SAM-dependent methyltransferase [Chitinispirillaceae bacterium]
MLIIISFCIGITGLITAAFFLYLMLAQKKKFSSPFLHKYPLEHPMSPIPDIEQIRKRADFIYKPGITTIPGVHLNQQAQLALLEKLSEYCTSYPLQQKQKEGYRFNFNNVFFTGHDAVLLYSLLRHFKPKRVVEVGSGFSSAVMLDTRDAFPEINTQFTFIEPFPQRLNTLLKESDRNSCIIIEKYVQDVDTTHFTELTENDMVFVDTSHQMKVGSEVLYLLFEILPRLKPGILIHFHDVFWPFEYPREWVEAGRSWNEAYGLRSFLQYNDSFEILFFNSYIGTIQKRLLNGKLNIGDKDEEDYSGDGGSYHAGGSLWLRKIK